MSHTPGPWHSEDKIDKRSDGYIRGELVLHGAVAGVAIARVCGSGPETRANARLMAAAPELLEALEALPLDSFGDDMATHDAADFVDHAGEFFGAMTLAKAAIAKAKGEPQ